MPCYRHSTQAHRAGLTQHTAAHSMRNTNMLHTQHRQAHSTQAGQLWKDRHIPDTGNRVQGAGAHRGQGAWH